MSVKVDAFFHMGTSTISYVVSDPKTARAAIIDSVLDYDPRSGRTSTESADAISGHIESNGLTIEWILDTHPHADHITAAQVMKDRYGAPVAIGADVVKVQETFREIYNLGSDFRADGSQFDRLLDDGDRISIGELTLEAFATPGHTPACMTYAVDDAAFVGDAMFMPDYGSARTDFPGGDAAILYDSIMRIYALPPETRIFVCHDYAPNGRGYAWETTVAEERESNIHLRADTGKEAFVKLRKTRDVALSLPELIVAALQVNIRAGRFPEPESNGVAYLKVPINGF